MLRAHDLLVISDIHLAAERGVGLFQADDQLVEFLTWAAEASPNVTLVINGDFLDYLVVEPKTALKDAFNLKNITTQTERIIEHHPEVFDALSRLAQKHQLTILGGNHDPELAFHSVQQVIENRLGLGGNGAAPFMRWFVHGEAAAIRVGHALAVIEHGDMYDDWNRIDRDALRRAVSLDSRGLLAHHRYTPPPGSQLVIEYVTALRGQYPWVDLLKPERETVIPLLFSFLPPLQRIRLLGALRKWLASLQRSAISELRRAINPARLIRAGEEIDSPRIRFVKWLEDVAEETKRGSSEDDKILHLIPKLRAVAGEDSFFDFKAADSAYEDVAFIATSGADVIVQGHTHSAKAYEVGSGIYLNTGTWARLLQLPGSQAPIEEWREFLLALSIGTDGGAPRPTFARVKHEDGQTSAALLRWSDGAPSVLSDWISHPEAKAWTER